VLRSRHELDLADAEHAAQFLAAALIYGRHNHVINLFTWPSAAHTEEVTQDRNGYHLLHWSSNGMTFWAVSDLNETELGQFVSLYRRN
jgi:anti-sigma factor RsiW